MRLALTVTVGVSSAWAISVMPSYLNVRQFAQHESIEEHSLPNVVWCEELLR